MCFLVALWHRVMGLWLLQLHLIVPVSGLWRLPGVRVELLD
jgi:hypothetical protein